MKRSEFLKKLGLGVVAIPLVPKVAAEAIKVVREIDDEAGNWPDGVEPNWSWEKKDVEYSHYEEPRVHDMYPWPLRINDAIIIPGDEEAYEKVYLVTAVDPMNDIATLTPFDSRDGGVIYAKQGDKMIRFSNAFSEL